MTTDEPGCSIIQKTSRVVATIARRATLEAKVLPVLVRWRFIFPLVLPLDLPVELRLIHTHEQQGKPEKYKPPGIKRRTSRRAMRNPSLISKLKHKLCTSYAQVTSYAQDLHKSHQKVFCQALRNLHG